MIKTKKIHIYLAVCIISIIASLFFGLLYHYDNKYTTTTQISQGGAIVLPDVQSEDGSSANQINWLIQGWEFYPDQLLYPEDSSEKSISLYIGQYFSFAKLHESQSPFGIGTYHLTLQGNGNYTMWIPEVFSSCLVYVNGNQVASSGSISPYEPSIKDLIFSFEVEEEAEIFIQTANYSHYYSGMTYPPAIGSSEAIHHLITIRTIFYGFLVFTSLALVLFAAVIWFGTKKSHASSENFWLGILGLSFSLHVSYPFIHTLGISDGNLAYVLENTMTAFELFCIVRTVSLICLKTNALPDRILKGITTGFLLIVFIFSFYMTNSLPGFIPTYGQILYWYKALMAISMILIVIHCMNKNTSTQFFLLLTGLLLYALSLFFHALCFGHFEPAYTGWFEEWGTYLLILCFAVRMALRNMEIIHENKRLTAHLQEEVAQKTKSLSKLLEERRFLLSEFAHDLKTPITSILTFTRLVEMDNTQLDEESQHYLETIRQKTKEIQEQLRTLNAFTQVDAIPSSFRPLNLQEMLYDFYEKNKPDIDVNDITFVLSIECNRPLIIQGDSHKLFSVLQNLVFNALSFTPEGGTITLRLSQKQSDAILCVEDSGTGIAKEDLPYIFDRLFTSRKNEKNNGMGLFIVKSILTEHKGTIEVSSQLGKGTIFTIKLPLLS